MELNRQTVRRVLLAGACLLALHPTERSWADLLPGSTMEMTLDLTPGTTAHAQAPTWVAKQRPGHRKHRIRRGARQIQSALKSTSPNPRVRGGSTSALPPQAPDMPAPPVPMSTPPKTDADRFFNTAAKIMTKSWGHNLFVWLPAISTDPNSGPTVGILPVLVISDPTSHRIRHLIAPSYTYNELFGQTITSRYYFYPTEASQMYVNASISQYVNRELKFRYENPAADDGVLYVKGEVYRNVDASPRFFGLGPETHEQDESGYISKASSARGAVGINFLNAWRATVGARFLHVETGQNITPDVDDLAKKFPDVPGIGTNDTVTNEFHLLWDTRDSPVTPTYGSAGEFYVEKTSLALGSDADYLRYGLEGRRLFPWKDGKQTTVIHGIYDWANGPFIPFYDLPSVGGRTTLRGFGEGRLTDRGRLVLNVEQRYTFAQLEMMGIQTNFEVAPFFDLGSVFPTLPQARRNNFRPVFGGAFRVAVKPNVVGDIELGIGREGPAVFVDINYPY
jgi:hypothetical protein